MEDIEKRLRDEIERLKNIADGQTIEIEQLAHILARSLTEREAALLRLPARLQVLLRFKYDDNGKTMGN